MILHQGDFSQIHGVVVLQPLRPENQLIPGHQHHIPAGNNDFRLSLDHRNNNPFGQLQFLNGLSGPGIFFAEFNPHEVQAFFPLIVRNPLRPGILLDEAGGNNTGGNGNHPDAEEGDDDAQELAHRGDRIDIAVADRQQC